MTAHDTEVSPSTARRSRSRKIRAVLAGGLVLGIGAAITLAAWTDNEYASGTFAAGRFNLEGATDGAAGTYSDHTAPSGSPNGPAPLSFTAPFSNLSPNTTVYAGFWTRLAAGTTTGASLRLAAIINTPGTTDATANLSWSVYPIAAAATCNATSVQGVTALQSGATLASQTFAGGTNLPLTQGANATTAGAPQQLCFVVTAGSGLAQGSSATGTWQFAATSN